MGIYQITWKYRMFDQQFRNTFYYDTSVGEPTDAEWQDIADEIRVDWVAEMQSNVSDELTLYGIDRRRVDQAGLLTFSQPFTAGEAVGSSAADAQPTQIALLVSNKGATTKPNRARSYLPGWTDGSITDSLYGLTARNAGQDLIDLQSNLNSGGTNPLARVAAQWNTSHTQVIVTNDLSGAASVSSAPV